MNQTVKIIKLINGDDIVTVLPTGEKQLPDTGALLRLDKPLQIKYIPQMTPTGFRDYIALIRWTNYTGDKVITIPKDKIMTITSAGTAMTNSYVSVSSAYDKATMVTEHNQDSYEREELDDDVSKKLNEIFDSLDDTTKH
mgnify:CR=1 FL=1